MAVQVPMAASHAIHCVGNLVTEQAADIVKRSSRVLGNVVQNGGDQHVFEGVAFGKGHGLFAANYSRPAAPSRTASLKLPLDAKHHFEAVNNVRLAVFVNLPFVGESSKKDGFL